MEKPIPDEVATLIKFIKDTSERSVRFQFEQAVIQSVKFLVDLISAEARLEMNNRKIEKVFEFPNVPNWTTKIFVVCV